MKAKSIRNRTFFLIAFILLVLKMPVWAQNECSYLVWADEFNYEGAPNTEKWGYDIGGNGWGNNELQYYTASRNNSFVEDGKLLIKALKPNDKWTSARMVTKTKGDWLYGRVEVKAKLPAGKGTWPAIWMLPTDWEYGGWPASGEIDIMEHVGYEMGKIHGTIHTEAYNHSIGTQLGASVDVANVDNEFHEYVVDWTPEKIVWYVDSVEYYRVANENKTYKEWPFDKRFHLILNIAVGGNWGGAQGVDPDLNEATMEVDYVRVYQNTPPKPVIDGKKNANSGEKVSFSTENINGANYKWTFPQGVSILQGADSSSVNVQWGDTSGNVFVELYSNCDTILSDSFFVEKNLNTGLLELEKSSSPDIKVWPNPFQQHITISAKDNIASVQLFNLKGTVLATTVNIEAASYQFSPQVEPGAYILKTTLKSGEINCLKIVKGYSF